MKPIAGDLHPSISFDQLINLIKQLSAQDRLKLEKYLRRETSTIGEDKIVTHIASESVLANDWLSLEEDQAWENL